MNRRRNLNYRNPLFLIGSRFLKLYLLVGLLLRVVLMCTAPQDAQFSFVETLRLLGIGLATDLGVGLLCCAPLLVIYPGLNELKYNRWVGWCIEVLLLGSLIYVYGFHSIFDEYGGGAPKIAKIFLTWKFVSFSLRFGVWPLRDAWRRFSLYFTWGIYVLLLLVVSMGEYFFWQEFGVRYNFIAVDYLVYTHEVLGNIMESYAIVPLMVVAVALSVGIVYLQSRRNRFKLTKLYTGKLFAIHTLLYLLLAVGGYFLSRSLHRLQTDNQYVDQLSQNGAYDFVNAFVNNKLDYAQFYAMLSRQTVVENYRRLTGLNAQGSKVVGYELDNNRPNIVLITVESLSAEFLSRYGNTQHITPYLDRLMGKSLVFDRLYATGNRTVRGLEALSLCIPPSAGESIIKRKANRMGNLSIAEVMKGLGYRCQYLYGGYSYFDNMGDFFSHNGYEVIDRSQINPRDINFANIWGVSDEDMFNKALSVFNRNATQGEPFFAQIMTTSNHRPYTYPEGRIQFDGDPHCREAAVKYTDYAIHHFLQAAAKQPWFSNTVFVVIADHCASSAGKTSLPVDQYHIPCIVYAPQLIRPGYEEKVCSQIDVLPTLLALLHLKTTVHCAGQNIYASTYRPRAFMATYQDLGYLENDTLTVLSPVRNIRQYRVKALANGTHEEQLLKQHNKALATKAQSYYQFVNLYLNAK